MDDPYLSDRDISKDNASSEEGESSRWMWQKPNDIINLLGDLSGKTVADIGAGPYGYFSFGIALHYPKKVIAIDIDPAAIEFMDKMYQENMLQMIDEERGKPEFETRLVDPDDPKLKPAEADIVLIVNTIAYFEDPVAYFKNVKSGMTEGAKIMIVDFKMKHIPVLEVPNELKVPINEVEAQLRAAGFQQISTDDQILDYQYIVTAYN